MIDKIISALESMQEDMEEHGELQKARGVSSAIWLIANMRDWADRKTENSSEIPNNCEPQTERAETMSCQECKWWFTDSLKHGGYCQSLLYNHECRYEPEVDCRRCVHFTTDKCQKCFGKELFIDSGYITKLGQPETDCSWK